MLTFNPFNPEFTIEFTIHPLQAANCCRNSRLVADEDDLKWVKNCRVLVNKFLGNIHSKPPSCGKFKSVFRDVKWCFNASWGLKGLRAKLDIDLMLDWPFNPYSAGICFCKTLTLSDLNLPLSSSSTTSRELLSQFSTCSEWRWLDLSWKLKKIVKYW